MTVQIREMTEQYILRDILREEERVPSTNELSRLYAINPATAAKGVNLLVDEGILYKKRGIGMFVATGAKEAIRKKRRKHFYEDYVQTLHIARGGFCAYDEPGEVAFGGGNGTNFVVLQSVKL